MQGENDEQTTLTFSGDSRSAQKRSLYQFGYYQKRLFVLLFLSSIPNSFSTLQFLATHYTPPFDCGDDTAYGKLEGVNGNGQMNNTTGSNMLTIQSNIARLNNDTCTVLSPVSENSTKFAECSRLIFHGEYTTATSEFEMVCDKAWLKPTMVMLYMIGKMVGVQIAGFFSDRFGRRVVFLAATFWQFFTGFLVSFASGILPYGVLIFFAGQGINANYYTATLLGIESVVPSKRKLMYFALGSGFALGYMVLPALMYFIPNWRWFLRATSLVGIFYIPYFWLIDETPLWLLINGTEKQAKALLFKIARMNNLNASDEIEGLIVDKKHDISNSMKKTFKDVAKTCKAPLLVWSFVVSLYSWTLIIMTYYVIALNNDNLSGNKFLNVFYAGVMELASNFLFFFGSAIFGGRNSYIILSIMLAIGLSISPVLALWSGTAVVVVTMANKLFASISFNLVYVYTGELFPTNTRQSTVGMITGTARVGGMLSPFIIYAGESGSTFGPYLGMGGAVFLSAVFYCFLPNTTKSNLPNTVEEAKSMKFGLLSRFKKV